MKWVAVVCMPLVLLQGLVLRAHKDWVWLSFVMDRGFHNWCSFWLCSHDHSPPVLALVALIGRHFNHHIFWHTLICLLHHSWGSCCVSHDRLLQLVFVRCHRKTHYLEPGVLHPVLFHNHMMTLVQSIRNALGWSMSRIRNHLWLWHLSLNRTSILGTRSEAATNFELVCRVDHLASIDEVGCTRRGQRLECLLILIQIVACICGCECWILWICEACTKLKIHLCWISRGCLRSSRFLPLLGR